MNSLLKHHEQLLKQWRNKMNLVGPGPLHLHYADALEALKPISNPTGSWVDLGTGAGFPGIIFASMYPNVSLDLVDSRSKRCAFLDRVLATFEQPAPAITVRCERLENLPDSSYDGVVSRALAPPAIMLEHARRLLRPRGLLLLLLQEEAIVPTANDFHCLQIHKYTIEGKNRKSALLSWRPDLVAE